MGVQSGSDETIERLGICLCLQQGTFVVGSRPTAKRI
jgi:hypothetical protein